MMDILKTLGVIAFPMLMLMLMNVFEIYLGKRNHEKLMRENPEYRKDPIAWLKKQGYTIKETKNSSNKA